VHLVGFIIRIYHDARSFERQIGITEGADITLHRNWRVINGSDQQSVINLHSYIKTQFPDKRDSYTLKETYKATRNKQTAFIYKGESNEKLKYLHF